MRRFLNSSITCLAVIIHRPALAPPKKENCSHEFKRIIDRLPPDKRDAFPYLIQDSHVERIYTKRLIERVDRLVIAGKNFNAPECSGSAIAELGAAAFAPAAE